MSRSQLAVLFLTGDPDSASARVRVLDHVRGLREHGIAAELRAVPRSPWARRAAFQRASEADVVVLHRRLLGPLSLRQLRSASRRLLFDLDDAVWERPFHSKPSPRNRRRFRRLLRVADGVIVGSIYLRRQVSHRCVHLLPPASPPPRVPVPAREVRERLRLVWTGSAATLPYLEDLGPVLTELAGERSFVLDVLADRPPSLPKEVPLEFHPWSLEEEERVLSGADLGLYPLRSDPWSRGKCAYKVYRYMAFGLATVGSRYGAGEEAMSPPEAGLCADTPEEWGAALRQLFDDQELRATMGARALALAESRDLLHQRTAELARILQG